MDVKVEMTEEVRCSEKAKGGLKYEVILAEPTIESPKTRITSKSADQSLTEEEIKEKLKAAEERRLSFEAKKAAAIAEHLSKLEENSKKKKEEHDAYVAQVMENLTLKMEQHLEKRESLLKDMKSKLQDHEKKVEMIRQKKVKNGEEKDVQDEKPIIEA